MSDSEDYDNYEDNDEEEDDYMEISDDDDFAEEDEAPKKKKVAKSSTKKTESSAKPKKAAPKKGSTKALTKKATATKTSTKDPGISDDEEEEDDYDGFSSARKPPTSKKASNKEKTIEETYVKLDQREHILVRPDTYVGSIEPQEAKLWVFDEGKGMTYRTITYVPALYKIFDEILVNAADNYQRDKSMTTIRVTIDVEKNEISVYNDGRGIPIEIHPVHDIYVPELIFGHLLTSSNYNDEERKVTGGRNGFGAKLCNVYSTKFVVETVDGKKKYKQVFTNNMTERSEPDITPASGKSQSTKITFYPDLARFGMERLTPDTVALMTKRVYDVAGCNPSLKVSLNGNRIPVTSFEKYAELYIQSASARVGFQANLPHLYKRVNDRWEIVVSISTSGAFQQVSFVNSICTTKGGTHVEHAIKPIIKVLKDIINKKNKGGVQVKDAQIKAHMWVFVNCLIENPSFDSQTKETLTLQPSKFGSKCELPEDFVKKVSKCGIVEAVLAWAQSKNTDMIAKKLGGGKKRTRLTGVAKLDDANDAGGKNSQHCTLILTEGDSAKAMAVSGLGVVGRDRYGVFPLKGKPLNVRDATMKQITSNEEIKSIMQIMGLKLGTEYSDARSLRYGHLMIMTDQDEDGSHIKGLLINFIHNYWPSLLKVPGFLKEFVTPIVKARHARSGRELSFFTLPEYQNWKKEVSSRGEQKGWKIKYYKGLGTSTRDEAREYFSNIERHRIDFVYSPERDDELIDMAFNKKKADDRKEWLRGFEPGTFIDHSKKKLGIDEFINRELILFSLGDCERSIPSVVDGLKPGQRKILYSCFLKNVKKEIKVAQLAGLVARWSAYHHGEQSLMSTIIGMAQDFVGSQNINILRPIGQFGTRLQGGKDAASPRYIFTCLNKLARALFHPDDDKLLKYLDDDGYPIEPQWYIPIIPMVLVNGSAGIGTGWSTKVPCYNPRDIVDNIRRMLRNEEPVPMHPWYRGFTGTIVRLDDKASYECVGIVKEIDDENVEITELPIGTWTQTYKEILADLRGDNNEGSKKSEGAKKGRKKTAENEGEEGAKKEVNLKEPIVADFTEHHTDTIVHFKVTLHPGKLAELKAAKGGMLKKLKLVTHLSVNNMHLFDSQGRIRRYGSVEDILADFYTLRLEYYAKRKEYLVSRLESQRAMLANQVRFIRAVIAEEVVVKNRKRADLLVELEKKGFDTFTKSGKLVKKGQKEADLFEENAAHLNAAKSDDEDEEDEEDEEEDAKGRDDADAKGKGKKAATSEAAKFEKSKYDYLLSMPLWSLTLERVKRLEAQLAEKEKELSDLLATTEKELWERDLDRFMELYEEFEREYEESFHAAPSGKRAGKATAAKSRKPATAKAGIKRKKADLDDEDDSEDDYDKPPPVKKSRAEPETAAVSMSTSTTASTSAAKSASTISSKQSSLLDTFKVKKDDKENVPSNSTSVKSAPAKTAAAKPESSKTAGGGHISIDLSDDDIDDWPRNKPAESTARKPTTAVTATVASAMSSKSLTAKAAPAAKPTTTTSLSATSLAKTAPKTKKIKADSEEDDVSSEEDSEDDDMFPKVAPPPRARSSRAVAKKAVNYKKMLKDSDEEEDDDEKADDSGDEFSAGDE